MAKEIKSLEDKMLDIVIYILLTAALVIVIYPLYFVVIASFSDPASVNLGEIRFLPRGVTMAGYKKILEHKEIWIGYRNTIFYTFTGTILNLVLTLTAAYSLSRKDLAGRNIFMGFLAFTMFFGGGLIPFYFLIKNLGMLNSIWVMILPGAVSVYNVIIARTFFQTNIPDEMLEAAQIDGCSDVRFFASIVLPLSKAIVAVLTLYYAVGHWNAFFNALIFITNRSLYPLQLVLRDILIGSQLMQDIMQDTETVNNTLQLSESMKYGAIIVGSIPVLMLYPFLQKYFMKGVMIGAIKG